ncbi:type 2 periplasmic-binding domain-containing protein [Herbidospora sp. RD11066]
MWRVLAAGIAALSIAAGLSGCSGAGLLIGVRAGQPGLAERQPSGGWSGFDIAVAHYVARQLGYRNDQIRYTTDLAEADLVMGPAREPYVGPYLVAAKDILVRVRDRDRTLKDLAGGMVCGTRADTLGLSGRFGAAWRAEHLAEANVPAACGPLLADRRTDAIIADAPVLAGLSAQYPGRFRLVGRPLAQERYGIGLSERTESWRGEIEDALRQMFDDGSWHRAVIDYLGELATQYEMPPALEKR